VESETGKREGRWGRRGGPLTSGEMGMEVTGRDGGNVPPARPGGESEEPNCNCKSVAMGDWSVGPVVVPNPFSVFDFFFI